MATQRRPDHDTSPVRPRLIDTPEPTIERAAGELRLAKATALPVTHGRPAEIERAEAKLIDAMLDAECVAYQGYTPSGQLFHVALTLPSPKVSVRWQAKGTPRSPAQLKKP